MHKFFKINRYFCLGFVAIALFQMQMVCASDEQFQNNLLRMEVYKTSLGAVKVTLYTTKPYKDSVVVNKKNDLEYVILMPETANLLTSKPTLKSASDVLANIEVKTQQYGSTQGQKGYTKITISALRPVEITPQVQTLNVSESRLSENETRELLQQASKKQSVSPAKQQLKVAAKKTPDHQPKDQANPQPKVQPAKKLEPPKSPQKSSQRVVQKQSPTTLQKSSLKGTPKTAQKPAALEKNAILSNTVTQPLKPVENKPVQQQEATGVTQEPSVSVQAPITAPPVVDSPAPEPIETPTVGKFAKYKKYIIILSSNKDLFAIILIPIIIFLLMLRIIRKNRLKKHTGIGLSSKPPTANSTTTSAADYLDDETDWKEKFKNYKNQPAAQSHSDDFAQEEVFGEEPPFEEFNFQEEQAESADDAGFGLENLYGENIQAPEPQVEAFSDILTDSFAAPADETNVATQDEYQEEDSLWQTFEEEAIEEASIDDLFNDEENIDDDGEFAQEEFSFEQAFEESEAQPFQLEEVSQEVIEEDLITQELGLSKKAGFSIDATKGFYLLDFEETTALVGYVGEEIFVLKRFEEPLQGSLQARMSEHTGTSATYIVRVGNFKALIEVTPEKMSLLLEL